MPDFRFLVFPVLCIAIGIGAMPARASTRGGACAPNPFADSIVESSPVTGPGGSADVILGPPFGGNPGVVNFDDDGLQPGFVVVGFEAATFIEDGPGPDFRIHLFDFYPGDPEPFEVFVSVDGLQFRSLGVVQPNGLDSQPTQVELDISVAGLATARYVKIVNERFETGYPDEGPDLDALELLNCGTCADRDADGWCDSEDNCPDQPNPGQEDVNANGVGDICECEDDWASTLLSSSTPIGDPSNLFGTADSLRVQFDNDGTTAGFVAVAFDGRQVIDRPGPDLEIHGDFSRNEDEVANILASDDGVTFYVVATDVLSATTPVSFDLAVAGLSSATSIMVQNGRIDDTVVWEGPDLDALQLLHCATCSDLDSDGWCDRADNCPDVENPGQEDVDGNGVGDACECAGMPPVVTPTLPLEPVIQVPLGSSPELRVSVSDTCGRPVTVKWEIDGVEPELDSERFERI